VVPFFVKYYRSQLSLEYGSTSSSYGSGYDSELEKIISGSFSEKGDRFSFILFSSYQSPNFCFIVFSVSEQIELSSERRKKLVAYVAN